MKPIVVFRADGNSKMGLGHVFRSIAFAEMLMNDFECKFVIRNPLPTIVQKIKEVCSDVLVLPDSSDHEKEANWLSEKYFTGTELVILDGYHFRTNYQKALKNRGCKVICVDDIYAYHFVADVVINHAGGLSRDNYSASQETQFYLGLQYALLRKEFRIAAANRNYANREKALFICLGGADPNNDTLKVLKECEMKGGIEKYYIIIGSAYQYRAELENYISSITKEVKLLSNLSASKMVYFMKRCYKAVTSPSTVSYEYLSVGGELYLKVTANNQININRYFVEEGLAFSFNDFPIEDASRINKALQLQEQLLDGNSDNRLIKLVTNLSISKQEV